MTLPRSVARLNEELMRLPGIGPKSAARLAYFLLRAPEEQVRALGEAILELRRQVRFCSECFTITDAELDPCAICSDAARDVGVLCVVEAPLDVEAIERTQEYRGRYHVLHGAISPVEGIGPENLRIQELLARVERGGVREVIFATNASLEGEATAMYLRRQLEGKGLRLTRLARGLPVAAISIRRRDHAGARITGRSEM
jgi:recombination protein RecR